MKNQDLVDYLKECGVCQVCQLRYLKARGTEYKDMKTTFKKLHVNYETEETDEEELACKKQRLASKYCPACLGLFSPVFQEQLIQGIYDTDIAKFECNSIVVAISMPMLLQVRQLSLHYALLKKFGESAFAGLGGRSPDVPLKEAVKLILNPIICEKLQKDYDANGLMINIDLKHPQEAEEICSLKKLNEVAFPRANGRKSQEISRGVLDKQYTVGQISAKLFEEYLPIPPSIPSECLSLESVSLTGPIVFVAGRYRKVTRELSHTPWILNGKRVIEDSIEEIIMRAVAPHFCCSPDHSKVIFMSSGREDVDVRCLGKGRPFVLEIPNSKRTTLPRETAHQMELDIEKSLKVSVHNLQMVQRDELVHIKTGEEKKRKFYRAVCALNDRPTVEILEKLNLPEGFEIQQKTPIRVLHRRPLHTRPRAIYSLKASVDRANPRILVLDIVSQAGTYIKELVHGEFGRTTPSIASIIGQPIDIVALDVVGIDLEWPKEVDNSA